MQRADLWLSLFCTSCVHLWSYDKCQILRNLIIGRIAMSDYHPKWKRGGAYVGRDG